MLRRFRQKVYFIKKLKYDILSYYLLKRKSYILHNFLTKAYGTKRKKYKKKRYDFYRIGWVPRPIYKKRKTKFGKYFLKRQRFRYFYSFIRIKVFKKIVNRILKKKNAAFLFLYYMESRLDVLLYRINLMKSLRMSRQFIMYGKILINKKPIKSYCYNLKKQDFLTIRMDNFYFLKKYIYKNIMLSYVLANFPNYIEYDLNRLIFMFTSINLYDVFFFFKNIKLHNFFFLMNFYKKCIF